MIKKTSAGSWHRGQNELAHANELAIGRTVADLASANQMSKRDSQQSASDSEFHSSYLLGGVTVNMDLELRCVPGPWANNIMETKRAPARPPSIVTFSWVIKARISSK